METKINTAKTAMYIIRNIVNAENVDNLQKISMIEHILADRNSVINKSKQHYE